MTETIEVWHLVIEDCGVGGSREYHRSLHMNPQSARNKADTFLNYDVPELDEWYERPASNAMETQYVGYILDEIDHWPIRIEANREQIRDDTKS